MLTTLFLITGGGTQVDLDLENMLEEDGTNMLEEDDSQMDEE